MISSVRAPSEFSAIFKNAEEYVKKYFQSFRQDPSNGTINIGGERYVLVRAASLSVNFTEYVKSLYPGLHEGEAIKATGVVLYDIAYMIGSADAKAFNDRLNFTDPVAKLSAGPIHFSYMGWAHVDLKDECRPSMDETSYLLFDHNQSFEADSWISGQKKVNFCTCFMNSGYSAGWTTESFGIQVVSREILCRSKGDPFCRFINSPPDKLEGHIAAYMAANPELFNS